MVYEEVIAYDSREVERAREVALSRPLIEPTYAPGRAGEGLEYLPPSDEPEGAGVVGRYSSRRGWEWVAVPRTIDSRRPYPEGAHPEAGSGRRDYLGGLDWTPEAWRYFGPLVPSGVARYRRLRAYWWEHAPLVAEVETTLGSFTCTLLLRWLRDGEEYTTCNRAARQGKRNTGWLAIQRRRAARVAREYLAAHPYSPKHQGPHPERQAPRLTPPRSQAHARKRLPRGARTTA